MVDLDEANQIMASKNSRTKSAGSWIQKFVMLFIKFLGWKIKNTTHPTTCKKAVIALAPHTSNWDFFYGMLFKLSHPNLTIRFAIKKEVMVFPLSYLMSKLGAIPIDRNNRTKQTNMVTVMADMINGAGALVLAIAPEGTRSYVKRWKTGFYRLAQAANVPIILGYIDYNKKEMGLGPTFHPTGNMEKDIENIQTFYRNIAGKYPKQGVI